MIEKLPDNTLKFIFGTLFAAIIEGDITLFKTDIAQNVVT